MTAFLSGLFGAGAFAGATAAQAYTVACDATHDDRARATQNGIVNVNVQFAPIDPAEFVMLNIQIERGVGRELGARIRCPTLSRPR